MEKRKWEGRSGNKLCEGRQWIIGVMCLFFYVVLFVTSMNCVGIKVCEGM